MTFSTLRIVFAVSLLALAVTGCYRAPSDDDFCTIPTTNNCSITRHVDKFQPGVAY